MALTAAQIIHYYYGHGGGFTPSAEYQAILDQAATDGVTVPDLATQRRQDALMVRLKAAGYLAKRVAFWVTAGDPDAEEFATYNWVDPSSHRLTKHATSGNWAGSYSSAGFAGDSTKSYINTHWNPSTQGGGLFTQNDACIDLFVSNYGAQADRSIFGLRNLAGTAQIQATIRATTGSTFGDNTRFQLNDATNANVSGNPRCRGLYHFKRISSTTKKLKRFSSDSADLSVNSVTVPAGELYLLARNSLSTSAVDTFSGNTIGFFGVGSVLTSDEENNFRNAFLDYFLAQQLPLFAFGTGEGDVIYNISGAGWDSGAILGEARYGNVAIYGGSSETGAETGNYDIGAFDYNSLTSGTKDSGNPIFDISTASKTSAFPMSVKLIGSTLYWLVSVRDAEFPSTINLDTALFTSPLSDPKNLTYIDVILGAGGSGRINHGAYWFDNPLDTDNHYIIYSHRNDSSAAIRINIATCAVLDDVTDPLDWSVLHSNIIAVPFTTTLANSLGQVYPFIFRDTVNNNWKLLYGQFWGEQQVDSFSIFSTESSDLSSFPAGKETLWPTGVSGDEDAQYASLPRLDTSNLIGYYSGRIGGASAPYTSRLYKTFTKNY